MRLSFGLSVALSALLTCASLPVRAQSGNGLDNPDWAEQTVALPPAFSTENLLSIDMPAHVSVKIGVDPSTIAVGSDGVVRYVIVMRNATGNVNAVYEGIRCVSDEVKTYARLSASGQWAPLNAPAWKPMGGNMPSNHARALARQGACQNRLATSTPEIIAALKAGQKFGSSARTN